MTEEEIGQLLSKIDKKQDKILKLVTVVAKALHLVPVSEKEERDMQMQQRKNAATTQKIQEEFANLEEKHEENEGALSFDKLLNASQNELYEDIIGDDILH